MTKEEFYKILDKPKSECDGCELHLRHCFDNNKWKSVFRITGLDFSNFGGEEKTGLNIEKPVFRKPYKHWRAPEK